MHIAHEFNVWETNGIFICGLQLNYSGQEMNRVAFFRVPFFSHFIEVLNAHERMLQIASLQYSLNQKTFFANSYVKSFTHACFYRRSAFLSAATNSSSYF